MAGAAATPAPGKDGVDFRTPSTGMPRPEGAPKPSEELRPAIGYGHNTPTGQAKNAYSTKQTEDKARRRTAELTDMRVKYRAALRQTPPDGTVHPAETADLGPPTANCIRSALDAQEALADAAMADLQELVSSGSPSAATILGSFQLDVRAKAMCDAIKYGNLEVGIGKYKAFPVGGCPLPPWPAGRGRLPATTGRTEISPTRSGSSSSWPAASSTRALPCAEPTGRCRPPSAAGLPSTGMRSRVLHAPSV